MLTKQDKIDLVWAMRKSLMEQISQETAEGKVLTESAKAAASNFILNEATYEQLLNLTFNPDRDDKYLPASVLEARAVEVYEAFLVSEAEKEKGKLAKAKDAVVSGAKSAWKAAKRPVDTTAAAGLAMHKKGGEMASADKAGKVKKAAGAALAAVGKKVYQHPKAALGAAALSTTAAGVGTAAYLKKRADKKAAASTGA